MSERKPMAKNICVDRADLLDWVHGKAGPDPCVVRLVVQRVHVLVKPRKMQPPMDEVEVNCASNAKSAGQV